MMMTGGGQWDDGGDNGRGRMVGQWWQQWQRKDGAWGMEGNTDAQLTVSGFI